MSSPINSRLGQNTPTQSPEMWGRGSSAMLRFILDGTPITADDVAQIKEEQKPFRRARLDHLFDDEMFEKAFGSFGDGSEAGQRIAAGLRELRMWEQEQGVPQTYQPDMYPDCPSPAPQPISWNV